MNLRHEVQILLNAFGASGGDSTEGLCASSPIDGSRIGGVVLDDEASIREKVARSREAFRYWRMTPAPKRGELIRLFGEAVRNNKAALGKLVSIESGKILQEGLGEVQEVIDICEFAVGLSRQLHGLTIASERPGHRMMETWHPLVQAWSSPPLISLSRYGPGTPRLPSCAATPCFGNPLRKRHSPR